MFIANLLMTLFLFALPPGLTSTIGFAITPFSLGDELMYRVAQVSSLPTAEQECLVNGQVPPWTTINPNDSLKTLWAGEMIEMSLNLPKTQDGSSATCQYKMRLRSDPTVTWDCLGLSNSERLKKQNEQPKTVMWDKLESVNEVFANA